MKLYLAHVIRRSWRASGRDHCLVMAENEEDAINKVSTDENVGTTERKNISVEELTETELQKPYSLWED